MDILVDLITTAERSIHSGCNNCIYNTFWCYIIVVILITPNNIKATPFYKSNIPMSANLDFNFIFNKIFKSSHFGLLFALFYCYS